MPGSADMQGSTQGFDPVDLAIAHAAACAIAGVRVASVRGRWMGRSLLLEVEGHLDADLSISVPAARTVRWFARIPRRAQEGS
jgi:hypothetical protein